MACQEVFSVAVETLRPEDKHTASDHIHRDKCYENYVSYIHDGLPAVSQLCAHSLLRASPASAIDMLIVLF